MRAGAQRPSVWMRALCASLLVAGMTACNQVSTVTGVTQPGVALSGRVHGGQQAVVGATIKLYKAGRSGSADGSASTSLLGPSVVTDSNGSFSITGDYTCSSTDEIYITATGGNPGLGLGVNANSAMMAALGLCSGLTSSTYIFIDEVTTVASISALKQFMVSTTALGSGPNDDQQLIDAFSLVNQLVNTTTGNSPGAALPGGSTAPTAAIYTLSDAVASCINSAGGTAGQNNACGKLFTDATPPAGTAPTDTIGALIDIFNNPTNNVSPIFMLAGSSGPFLPTLSTAPSTWTMKVTPAVTVAVSPTSMTLNPGLTQQFTATITNAPDTSAMWLVNGVVGGNATVGTISSSGLYTAPSIVSATTMVTITGVSDWDPTISNTATVTLNPNVTVTVTPTPVSVTTSATQQFTATLTGVPGSGVTWSLLQSGSACSSVCGTISTTGLYTAPSSVPTNASVSVVATSTLDPRQSGSAAVTIMAPALSMSVAVANTSTTYSGTYPANGVTLALTENSTQTFNVTVQNDPSNLGVTWALACIVDGYDQDGDCTNGTMDTYDEDSDNAFLSSTAGTSSTSGGVTTFSNTLTTPLFVPPGSTTKFTLTVKSKALNSNGEQLSVIITVSVP